MICSRNNKSRKALHTAKRFPAFQFVKKSFAFLQIEALSKMKRRLAPLFPLQPGFFLNQAAFFDSLKFLGRCFLILLGFFVNQLTRQRKGLYSPLRKRDL